MRKKMSKPAPEPVSPQAEKLDKRLQLVVS